jgi:tRNA nucleotidyltransferase (CCA-adding enzyme)
MEVSTNINIPPEVMFIMKTLNNNKYEAFIVGGCVRDSLLGKEPKDWDLTTNAKPEEIRKLFAKTIDTGIKHGTITIVLNCMNFEITTYRTEGEYLDNRRPENVKFTSSLVEDLSRRDFTMNAIAYNPNEGFIDPFKGINDITGMIIRAVGNADKRFKEAALRMLRGIRFSAELNFSLEQDTLQAIRNNNYLINSISKERIQEELTKLLVSEAPLRFLLLKDTEILQFILPEFDRCFNISQNNPYHIYNVAMHSLYAVSYIESNKVLRWVMLLHDLGKVFTKTTDENGIDHFHGHMSKSVQLAEDILKGLKFDNKTLSLIRRLIQHHDIDIEPKYNSVRKAINSIGDDIFMDLLKVKTADKKAQNPIYLKAGLDHIDRINSIYLDIKNKQECISISDLAIGGRDLIELGFEQNEKLGFALNALLIAVIEDPNLNKKEKLLELAKDFM